MAVRTVDDTSTLPGEYVTRAKLKIAGYVNIKAIIYSRQNGKLNSSIETGRAFITNVKRNHRIGAERAIQQCIYKHASKMGYNVEGVDSGKAYQDFRIVGVKVLNANIRYEYPDEYTVKREKTKKGLRYTVRNEYGRFLTWQSVSKTEFMTNEEYSFGDIEHGEIEDIV